MYQLTPAPTEDRWVDFAAAGMPGLAVLFAPIGRADLREARRAAFEAFSAAGGEGVAGASEAADDAFVAALARRTLRDWKGVGDAEGKAVPVTPAAVEMFLAHPMRLDAVATLHVNKALAQEASRTAAKKAPPRSRTGSSPRTGRPTAKAAAKTASAKPKAAPTSAPSGSTASKTPKSAKRGKSSGAAGGK